MVQVYIVAGIVPGIGWLEDCVDDVDDDGGVDDVFDHDG